MMNSKHVKACSVLLLLQIVMIGCEYDEYQNNQLIWEISPSNDITFIQNEVNGIEYKFCLLNEDGEPSTVFTEGDNFSLYFSVTNNRNDKLYFDPRFPFFENDFFRVYNSDNQDFGRSFNLESIYLTGVGIGAFPFPENSTHEYQVPWLDNNEALWIWSAGKLNRSTHKEPLPKGNYYTSFKYPFHISIPYKQAFYDTLSFKINFLIQQEK